MKSATRKFWRCLEERGKDMEALKRWAVEAKVFTAAKIVAKIRPAEPGEESGCQETRSCDVWVDIFDTYEEAADYLRDYRRG